MQLTLSQKLEVESLMRWTATTDNVQELRALARELADLYMRQRAATAWVSAEQ